MPKYKSIDFRYKLFGIALLIVLTAIPLGITPSIANSPSSLLTPNS